MKFYSITVFFLSKKAQLDIPVKTELLAHLVAPALKEMLGLKDQSDLPAKTATLAARALLDLKVNQANQATTEHQVKTDFRAHQALNPARLDHKDPSANPATMALLEKTVPLAQ